MKRFPLDELIVRIVDERLQSELAASPLPAVGTGDDTTSALLQSWIDQDATDDPEEIRKAEEELREFQRNMNAPRKEAGERLLFPEVE
jgi:hypothetical protein